MKTPKISRLPTPEWRPLAKGSVEQCVCDQEGCGSLIRVLESEKNIIEVYQVNSNSLWSCVARIVLPDDIALCQRVRPLMDH